MVSTDIRYLYHSLPRIRSMLSCFTIPDPSLPTHNSLGFCSNHKSAWHCWGAPIIQPQNSYKAEHFLFGIEVEEGENCNEKISWGYSWPEQRPTVLGIILYAGSPQTRYTFVLPRLYLLIGEMENHIGEKSSSTTSSLKYSGRRLGSQFLRVNAFQISSINGSRYSISGGLRKKTSWRILESPMHVTWPPLTLTGLFWAMRRKKRKETLRERSKEQ